ncbi:MAG: hypothetical protein ACI9QC_000230 [Oceanicoccus sp.]|jgi:hypothetical protein
MSEKLLTKLAGELKTLDEKVVKKKKEKPDLDLSKRSSRSFV